MVVLNVNAQKNKAVITFNDGRKVEGYGQLYGNKTVKFKKDKGSKSYKYHFSNIKEFEIIFTDHTEIYNYVKIEKQKNPKVLKKIVSGKVELFIQTFKNHNTGDFFSNVPRINLGITTYYYLRKQSESEAFYLTSSQLISKSFKKGALLFFKDCPLLVEKIRKRNYEKNDIIDVVEFYNYYCK
ncbi:MAG: hypothetical protein COB98_09845 [Flavobacteriaceae bacterium]|nr:MAG: hypothetical protein COB98_09845 [Flavobacteriaceae bacterium]